MAMLPLVLPQKDLCLFTGITTLRKGVYTDTLQTGHKVQVDVDTQGQENHCSVQFRVGHVEHR